MILIATSLVHFVANRDYGLELSVRVIRHIVSTAVAQSNASAAERADMCAANLHSVAVADRYSVVSRGDGDNHDDGAGGGEAVSPGRGDSMRGLGQSALPISVELFSV